MLRGHTRLLAAQSFASGLRLVLVAVAALGCGSGSDAAPSNPLPAITRLSPDSASQGRAPFEISVVGTDFVRGASVLWDGTDLPTTFESSTALVAQIATADLGRSGPVAVTVRNPSPGGGASASLPFTIWTTVKPVPSLTSLAPDHALVGTRGLTVRLTGTNFIPTSRASIDGTAAPTTFVSVTALDVAVDDKLLTTTNFHSFTVTNAFPIGGTTPPLSFSVDAPRPTITSIGPTTLLAGQAGATVAVDGADFVDSSVVRFAGAARATTHVSATRLIGALLQGDLRDTGTYAISVFTGAPGGGASSSLNLHVVAGKPTISNLPSAGAVVGATELTVAVDGSGFVSGVVATVNGQDRPTTFLRGDRLTFKLAPSDRATPGALSIAVRNPGADASSPVTFTIHPVPAATTSQLFKIDDEATDMIYDPARGVLYASVRGGVHRSQVIAIDPTSGQIVGSAPVVEPGHLALSSDGQHLYVIVSPSNIASSGSVRRLSLPSMATEKDTPISTPLWDIVALPGAPLSFALAAGGDVRRYDDGVLQGSSQIIDFIFAITPATPPVSVIAMNWFASRSVFGITFGAQASVKGMISDIPLGIPAFAAGRLYVAGSGPQSFEIAAMIDPDLGTIVGRFPAFGAGIAVDPALGRLFLGNSNTLTTYDLNTFQPLANVTIDPSLNSLSFDLTSGRIVRWGVDGVAMPTLTTIYIFRTGLAAP